MKGKGAAKTPHYSGPVKVMTVDEVAAYLRVSRSMIQRLLRSHQIPAFRVGSDWRFTLEQIDRWISHQHDPYRTRE